jgi:flavodoxin
MKTLIVYYSRTGLTKKLAEFLGRELGADTEEIIDKQDRSGAFGYLKSGRDAMRKRLTEIAAPEHDPSLYDLVIIGTPTWAFNMACAVRTYLTKNKNSFKRLAFFATHGSDGAEKAIKNMEDLSGRQSSASLVLSSREISNDKFLDSAKGFSQRLKELNL